MVDVALKLLAYFGVIAGIFMVPALPPWMPTVAVVNLKIAPPWAIALIASAATAVAASVDYHLVRRAFRIGALERARSHRFFEMFERWAKVAPFLTVLAIASFGPFFIPRILIPLSGYPAWKYATAASIGRYLKIFVIATVGERLEIPNEVVIAMLVVGAVGGGTAALVRRSRQRRAEQAKREAASKPPADTAS